MQICITSKCVCVLYFLHSILNKLYKLINMLTVKANKYKTNIGYVVNLLTLASTECSIMNIIQDLIHD